ncbi:unnamed protein product [Gordionus sp. m RMFG-2023]|uniref:caspase-3-like n=1 Tax=Gordionus sp. m RMFG-2023 TaxID=3053472 RepID=UPI0030E0B46A
MPILLASKVFNEHMIEKIYHSGPPYLQKFQFILDIQKRGPLAFKCFIDALFITGQYTLKNILLPHEIQLLSNHQTNDTTKLNSLSLYMEKDCGILDIHIKNSEVLFGQDMYDMRVKNKGLAIIINNENFEYNTNLAPRKGTANDCANLKNLFQKLGYTVIVKCDLTKLKMKEELDEFSNRKDHTSSCIISILSHGMNDKIYGIDGQLLSLDHISTFFDGKACPLLINKPKIFILQACRGDERDKGFFHTQFYKKIIEDDQTDSMEMQSKYPGGMDMIFAYATLPGFVSWRDGVLGTWFVRAIVKVFSEHSHEHDILDMLTKVNKVIIHNYESKSGHKMMSEFTSRLSKKFYFSNI